MHWILKRSDIMFAVAIVAVMTILIMPVPAFFMDFFLAISFTFSIMILMTVLFIARPLDFNSFPTIILVATMVRLSLNVASTRLILSHGHESTAAAGRVIEAFGEFVMEGNFVIGLIVFFILVIVNFVVITKGSGRIAEVSARFTLDSMPGKQMAIDADLSSGLISDNEAKVRRKILESESNFYGSMDGAGKFVRGDAIAGVLITFINIVGGIIIGVLQNDMSFNDAAHSYTLLSVGDGLVTQIPALLVSTAAGLLVTKGGHDETSNTIIFRQMGASSSALSMTSGVIAVLGILPGVPFFPFILLSGSIGAVSWVLQQNKIKEEAQKEEPQLATDTTPVAPPIDLIRLELGYGLLCLLEPQRMIRLNEQIKRLREQIAKDMGVILPAVRIQDNLTLDQNDYVIRIKEMESGKGTVRPDKILLLDAKNRPLDFPGEETKEPTFGLQAKWIDPYLKEQAEDKGYTIVDPAIVISTHLSEIVKDNMVDLFTYTDVQYLLDNLSSSYKKLLSEMIPGQITVSNIQRILQTLIGERISIRDLPTILEGIFEASHISRNIIGMTEHVRQRLARQITFQFADEHGTLKALTLSPAWEEELTQALTGEGEIKQLILAPSRAQEFVQSVRQAYKKTTDTPVVISSPHLRVHVRSLLEHGRPSTVVLGKNEIHPKAHLRFVGQI